MTNNYSVVSFDPFLYYQDSAQTIPDSSLTVHQPLSRSSSVNNASSSHHIERNNSYNFKDAKNGRNKKQKKAVDGKKKEAEEPPLGYIHVRARRGQATDSHSLAERVRREKISERMKVLQGLVPGCEKVVGKALMLDEIINYVQSLQNQVEFLSMKLACVNPMLFDFSVDHDCLVNQTELMPTSILKASLIQSTALEQGTSKPYETMMNPPPLWLQCQGPIPLSQENNYLLMQVGDERQEQIFNNMCMFQPGSNGEVPY